MVFDKLFHSLKAFGVKRLSVVAGIVLLGAISLAQLHFNQAYAAQNFDNEMRPMNLGSVGQVLELQPTGQFTLDSQDIPTAIEWKYVKKVTKKAKVDPQDLQQELQGTAEDYFVTVLGSGLGAPEIVSVRNVNTGRSLSVTQRTSNKDHDGVRFMNSVVATYPVSSLEEGTYEYIIKTPIVEHRSKYILDTNSRLHANFTNGQHVNVNTTFKQLTQNEELFANGAIRGVFDTTQSEKFKKSSEYFHPQDVMNNERTFKTGNFVQDNYTYQWSASAINLYQEQDTKTLSTNLDASQETTNGLQMVFVFKPGANGYEQKSYETPNSDSIQKDLDPSEIVVLKRKSWTNRNHKDKLLKPHTFGAEDFKAQIEPMFGRVKIVREWKDVPEGERTASTFAIAAPVERPGVPSTVTIPANATETSSTDNSIIKERFLKESGTSFKPAVGEYKFINWNVDQKNVQAPYFEESKSYDRDSLFYRVVNSKTPPVNTNQIENSNVRYGVTAIGSYKIKKDEHGHDMFVKEAGGTRGDFIYEKDDNGVILIDPVVKINQYEYYRNPKDPNNKSNGQYMQEASLQGRFRIPSFAKAGDVFTFELPQQLLYTGELKNVYGKIGSLGAYLGKNKHIADMYLVPGIRKIIPRRHDGQIDYSQAYYQQYQTIKFVLNANATWPQDYEGNFFIGDQDRAWDKDPYNNITFYLKSINGNPFPSDSYKTYHPSDWQDALYSRVVQRGFISNIDVVYNGAPYNKQLPVDADPQVKPYTEYGDQILYNSLKTVEVKTSYIPVDTEPKPFDNSEDYNGKKIEVVHADTSLISYTDSRTKLAENEANRTENINKKNDPNYVPKDEYKNVVVDIYPYFMNDYINKNNMFMRKYPVEEGEIKLNGKLEKYIKYRLVWNGGKFNWDSGLLPAKSNEHFFDYLPEGVELLYGNTQDGVNKSVKVWMADYGNISGNPNGADSGLNQNAYVFPPGATNPTGRVTATITPISRDYFSYDLNLSAIPRDNKNKIVHTGHKVSLRVDQSLNYDADHDHPGYVLVADLYVKANVQFGKDQYINFISSQLAERTNYSPAKIGTNYWSASFAGGEGYEDKTYGEVLFIKKIRENGADRLVKESDNITFVLTKDEDESFKTYASPNDSGQVRFKRLLNGTYRIHEIGTNLFYGLERDIEVVVNNGTTTINGQVFDSNNPPTFTNIKKPKLNIVKRDKQSGELVKGFEIAINKLNDRGIPIWKKPLTFGSSVESGNAVSTVTPYVQGIDPGTYQVVETRAPKGYSKELIQNMDGDMEELIYYIKVSENRVQLNKENSPIYGTYTNLPKNADGTYILTIENIKDPVQTPPIITDLKLLKRDSFTSKPLKGAGFTVYSNEGATAVDTSVTVTPSITDETGIITFEGLRSGSTYYIKETTVPESDPNSVVIYDKQYNSPVLKVKVDDQGVVTATLNSADVYNNIYDKYLHVDNVKKKGDFTIFKYVREGSNELEKEGAKFVLFTDPSATNPAVIDGKKQEKASGFDGTIRFAGLPFNSTYYLKETQAPEGCVIDNTIYKVVVDAVGRVAFYNQQGTTLIEASKIIGVQNEPSNGIRIENKQLDKSKGRIYVKVTDSNALRARRDQLQFSQPEGYWDTYNSYTYLSTAALYPENNTDQALGIDYERAGIRENIPELVAEFEVLTANGKKLNPEIKGSTNRQNSTTGWADNEIGSNFAEFELTPGNYILRQIKLPEKDGMPLYSKALNNDDIQFTVKFSSKTDPTLIFVSRTEASLERDNHYGERDKNGVYKGYVVSGYDKLRPESTSVSSYPNTLVVTNIKNRPLMLNKLDENERPLPGAQFKLDNGRAISSQTNNNKFVFADLLPGFHTITEVVTPHGKQPLSQPITVYKTIHGLVTAPSKRYEDLDNELKTEIDNYVVGSYGHMTDTIREKYKAYMQGGYTQSLLNEYYKSILSYEQSLIDQLIDYSVPADIQAAVLDANALNTLNPNQMTFDKYGFLTNEMTIKILNQSIPVTGLILNNAPMVLLVLFSGAGCVALYALRKNRKARDE